MAEQQGTSSAFAEAVSTMVAQSDASVAVPTIIIAALIAFLFIIGLSWLMDGKNASSYQGTNTPKKEPKVGLIVTPAGRRSTRKSQKPDILDPSQTR